MCFATGSAQEKIALFEVETSLWSLIICPISTSLFIVVITPWLKVLFGLASRLAYEKLNSQELVREHKYLAQKNTLEKERAKALANKESELIDQAKRDADIENIGNEDVREKLQKEIDELRKQRNQILHEQQNGMGHQVIQVSPIEKEILKLASVDNGTQIMRLSYIGGREIQIGNQKLGGIGSNREFVMYDDALESLIDKKLIRDIGKKGEVFELTLKGWELVSKLNFAA